MTDNPLPGWLQSMPSPIERGREDYETIMERGTPLQKETVLVILRALAWRAPGPGDIIAGKLCDAIKLFDPDGAPHK